MQMTATKESSALNENCQLFRLPLIVIQGVLSYLDIGSRTSARLTCHKLRDVIDDLWNPVSIFSPRPFNYIFPDFKLIHDFLWERSERIDKITWHLEIVRLIELLSEVPNLRKLRLTATTTVSQLSVIASACKFLEELHVEKIRPLKPSFWGTLQQFEHLQSLRMVNEKLILKPEDIEAMAQFFTSVGHLKILQLNSLLGLTSPSIGVLVSSQRYLRELTLNASELVDFDLKHLSRCQNLQKLHLLNANQLSSESLLFLSCLICLQDLRVTHMWALTDQGLMGFLAQREKNSCFGLTRLALEACVELTDVGVDDALAFAPRLKVLDLSSNRYITGCLLRSWINKCPLCLVSLRNCPVRISKSEIEKLENERLRVLLF